MWNILKQVGQVPGINSLDHYEKLAREDLERFKMEHASYVNKINELRRSNVKKGKQTDDEELENQQIFNFAFNKGFESNSNSKSNAIANLKNSE